MKRAIVLVVTLLLALDAAAQVFTTVSATITDPNGIPYAGGTIAFQLTNTSGVVQFASSPVLTASATPVVSTVGPVGLSSAGSFSIRLPNAASITPAGTKWKPTVCSGSGSMQPALGKGSQCFTTAAITIAGATQDISATLNGAAPALTAQANLAYNDATTAVVSDDFVGGLLTTGNVGALGWAMAGTVACGAATQPASAIPNLGQFQMTSGAAATNTCGITWATANAAGALGSTAAWRMVWVFKLPAIADLGAYVGASDSLTAIPSNWFGFRFDTSLPDAAFKLCAQATCDTVTYTADTNFHKLTIWSAVAGTIWMQLDSNPARSFCAAGCNVTQALTANALTPIAQAVTRGSGAQNVDVDYFYFQIQKLVR